MRITQVQWVASIGSAWVPLDPIAQVHIERLWARSSSGWIQSNSVNFWGAVYIDIDRMLLVHANVGYVIARRRH